MSFNRRGFLTGSVALMGGLALAGAPAFALSEDAAKAHVETTVAEVLALVTTAGSASSKAPELRRIMERRAALPQIARFSAGRAWNDMSGDQQDRYTSAFASYVASVYARRFNEYQGQQITVGRVIDAGKKGILVQSSVTGGGRAPVLVEWLVSDRGGSVQITDIVIEGVSLALTQREEIASMLSQRGNDVEKLIQALGSA